MLTGQTIATIVRCATMKLTRGIMKNANGSCLAEFGDTRVCALRPSKDRAPGWRKGSGKGWLTAGYAMLPAAGNKRTRRRLERPQWSQYGNRGASLVVACAMCATLNSMGGEVTMTIDCDVLQADGGTRTAAITGARGSRPMMRSRCGRPQAALKTNPLFGQVAAISVGLVEGRLMLDLDYEEDSNAEIDMNVVMNAKGEIVEIQGTGEQVSFSRDRLNEFLDMAEEGIKVLLAAQKDVLGIE